ncbi:MAG: BRCT domain-containing protein [Candidatus Heimdallarchaeaceae archaeon]
MNRPIKELLEKIVEEAKEIGEPKLGYNDVQRFGNYSGKEYGLSFYFNKGPKAESLSPETISDIRSFARYKNTGEKIIKELLFENGLEYNFENYAKIMLSAISSIYEKSHVYKAIGEHTALLSIYHEPAYILGHNFMFFSKEIKEVIIPDTISELSEFDKFCRKQIEEVRGELSSQPKLALFEIFKYYTVCKKMFTNKAFQLQTVSAGFDKEDEPFYYNSVDIFVALILTFWLIALNLEKYEHYIEQLNKFLTLFLTDIPKLDNFNFYMKSKFKFILLENRFSYLKLLEKDSNIDKEASKIKSIAIIGRVPGMNKSKLRLLVEELGFKWSGHYGADLVVVGNKPSSEAMAIARVFEDKLMSWEDFKDTYLTSKMTELEEKKGGTKKTKNKDLGKIYVTGKIPGKTKDEVRAIVEDLGFKWLATINEKLSLLVYGDRPGQKKIDAAKRFSIKLLSWDEFVNQYKIPK